VNSGSSGVTLLGSERRRAALTEPTDAARDGSEAEEVNEEAL